ncbi:MAG: glycosyl hydrolase [SAR324 cluster bacterium]|nr:glycosyl hydrolase [SAR324 cluster bacterium]MBL7035128.1 glycosyl hydrolase [SAR324 cluster bacterium]
MTTTSASNNISHLDTLRWRCIGPPRGGRVVAVSGDPLNSQVSYFGAAAGGIWKTEDGGTFWENVSDGFLASAAVGALTVAPSDPNVIYAGMGESTIRGDVSFGDGVYKSTDAGKSWNNFGLRKTRHISEIRVHPNNPDLVYVAAFGDAFGPNKDRGIYRSKDGGQNWEQILFRSEKAGAIDLSLDPNNPRILYASFWEAHRNFWSLNSGGPDSSLYRSGDGGETWTDITENPGLPKGTKGKIGVTVSPAQSGRVWAIIEAEKAGLYRSDNDGKSWIQTSGNRDLIHRPWYYCHVFADPKHADTVYITNLQMWKSTDGGSNFSEITTPHGDNHDLWIDPENTQRMVQGNDGGGCISYNGGKSWSSIYNQMTSQFYRMDIDNQFPYRVYATQQDNTSISVPSASEFGAITMQECTLPGTGESGFIAVKPDDPDIVYIGAVGSSPGGEGQLQHYNHRTKQLRLVNIWPEEQFGWAPKDLKYRFQWTFPISFSPHDSGTVYACGNHVFRTINEGHSWEKISPDLTRADKSKLGVSGGMTIDSSGAEHYGTISTFVESPHQSGVFWTGSDDGLVHTSRDSGKTWQNITPPDIPEFSYIFCIEVSAHAPETIYLSATRYKLNDYRPLIYKSIDGGQNWSSINGDYPETEISRVIREDQTCPGLLYVGSESGIYMSANDGKNWQKLGGNFPVVPVYDLKIKDDDLVVGTHGRSFWILDDLTPLREFARESSGKVKRISSDIKFFPPRKTYRRTLNWSVNLFLGEGKNYSPAFGLPGTNYQETTPDGEKVFRYLDMGENPPEGVIVNYFLESVPEQPLELIILDASGKEIDSFTTKIIDETQLEIPVETNSENLDEEKPSLPNKKGFNCFIWNMRYPGPEIKIEKALEKPGYKPLGRGEGGPGGGPLAPPGTYQVRLKFGNSESDNEITHSFEIVKDPRLETTPEDFAAQFDLSTKIRNCVSEVNAAINSIRRIKRQITELTDRENYDNPELESLQKQLETIETELTQTQYETPSDRLRHPTKLKERMEALVSVVVIADAAPPEQAHTVFAHLKAQIDEQLACLQKLEEQEVDRLNQQMEQAGIPKLQG